jgi:hypothetical protein
MFTDEILRQRWDITEDEWNFIDSKIKNIDSPNNEVVNTELQSNIIDDSDE